MHNSAVCGLRAAPEPLLLQHQRTTAACPSGCSHRPSQPPLAHPGPDPQVEAEQIVDFMYYAGSGARPGVNARPPQPIGDRQLKYFAA